MLPSAVIDTADGKGAEENEEDLFTCQISSEGCGEEGGKPYPCDEGKPVIEPKALHHQSSTVASQDDRRRAQRQKQAGHSQDLRSAASNGHRHGFQSARSSKPR